MTRLDEIRKRVDAATEGPWTTYRSHGVGETWFNIGNFYDHDLLSMFDDPANVCTEHPNATFIAHAREDVPYLLAFIESQAKEIEALREGFAPWLAKNYGPIANAVMDKADAIARERESLK